MLTPLLRSLFPRGTAARKHPQPKHRPRFSLHVEALEDRLTPAATVSFIDGGTSLVITGDGGDDNIIITEGAALGSFSVAGGGLNQTFTGITNIYVNLNGGATQSVNYVGAPGAGLAGKLGVSDASTTTFSLTVGNNANIGGNVTVQQNAAGVGTITIGVSGGATTTIGGSVVVYGGTGANTVTIDDAAIGGGLSANYNAAVTETINIGLAFDVTLGFVSVVNQASGLSSQVNVTIGLEGVNTINGNVFIGAGSNANLNMAGTTVNGYVSFNAGQATAAVNVSIANATISKFLSIVTGARGDSINLADAANKTLVVGENLAIVSGAGSEYMFFNGLTVAGTTSIDTGDDADVVNLDGFFVRRPTFNGAVNIQLGQGGDVIYFAAASGDTANAAVFGKGGTVDGGPGADLSFFKTTSDGVSPVPATQINIEDIVS